MLSAINKANEIIIAHKELKKEEVEGCKCRFCQEELIFKRGTVNKSHFAHKPHSTCTAEDNIIKGKCAKGESEFHRECKLFIKEQMERLSYVDRVDIEVPIGNRIADIVVYFNDKVDERFREKNSRLIVEIQLSKISISNIVERSEDYIKEGFLSDEIVWLVGEKNEVLYKYYDVPKIIKDKNGEFDILTYLRMYQKKFGEMDIFEQCTKYSKIYEFYKVKKSAEKEALCCKFIKDKNIDMIALLQIVIRGRKAKRYGTKAEIEDLRFQYMQERKNYMHRYKIDEERFNKSMNELIDISTSVYFNDGIFSKENLDRIFELMKEVFTIENIQFKEEKCKYYINYFDLEN